MDDDNKQRDVLNVADDKPKRPVFTPQMGSDFMRNFLRRNKDEEGEADAPAEPENLSPQQVQDAVIEELRQIFDPEIPVNIYELGLIYGVEVDGDCNVHVTMTLTTPHCPVAETMPAEVENRVRQTAGVNDVNLDLVWDPPWDMGKMSDEAKLELGLL